MPSFFGGLDERFNSFFRALFVGGFGVLLSRDAREGLRASTKIRNGQNEPKGWREWSARRQKKPSSRGAVQEEIGNEVHGEQPLRGR